MQDLARPLKELFKTTCPTAATILGKGPSLDHYTDSNGAGTYIVGLNDVSLAVKCNAAVFADDPFRNVQFPEQVTLFRHKRQWKHHEGRGYFFTLRRLDGWGNQDGTWPKDHQSSAIPLFGYGSLTIAIGILGRWGVRCIQFWGCDALTEDGDSTRIADRLASLNPVPATPEVYKTRAQESIQALEFFGIDWFNNTEALCSP